MLFRKSIFLLVVVLFFNKSFAQNHYEIATHGFYSNNERNTFWAQANQLGIVPTQTLSGLAFFSLNSDCNQDSLSKSDSHRTVKWGYGISGAAALTKSQTEFYLPIAYLKAKIANLEFEAGRFRQITGISGSHELSSGSFATSNNAMPVPGFRIGINDYLPIRITNNLISIKGFFSENFIGDNFIRYQSLGSINNTMLHRKLLAFRFGQTSNKLNILFSGNHQVIWGGNLINPNPDMINSSLGTYKSAILGKSASNLLVGDHIGSVDIGIEYKDYDWTYFVYRQNFYEGNGSNSGITWSDGLNGLEIRRHNRRPTTQFHINKALLEIISTTSQIDYNDGYEPHKSTQAISYYNQAFYGNGWSYKGRTMGNPLLANKALVKENLLDPTDDYLTNNNRILAFHTGIQGMIYQFPWTVKATYSLNSGTYAAPFPTKLQQFSFLVNTEVPIKLLGNTKLTGSISGDIGELYYNTICVSIGLRKNGLF